MPHPQISEGADFLHIKLRAFGELYGEIPLSSHHRGNSAPLRESFLLLVKGVRIAPVTTTKATSEPVDRFRISSPR